MARGRVTMSVTRAKHNTQSVSYIIYIYMEKAILIFTIECNVGHNEKYQFLLGIIEWHK